MNGPLMATRTRQNSRLVSGASHRDSTILSKAERFNAVPNICPPRSYTQIAFRPSNCLLAGTRATTVADVAMTETRAETIKVTYEPVPEKPKGLTHAEVAALYEFLTQQAKAKIQLYENNSPSYPTFKVSLKKRIGLGEAFKLVGACPELGRMKPEVAPSMRWTEGDVWVYEGKIQPGTFKYKVALRTSDSVYIWEQREDRIIDLNDSTSVELDVKFP